MQNTELEELEGKKVRFCLFNYDYKGARKAKIEAEKQDRQLTGEETEMFYK